MQKQATIVAFVSITYFLDHIALFVAKEVIIAPTFFFPAIFKLSFLHEGACPLLRCIFASSIFYSPFPKSGPGKMKAIEASLLRPSPLNGGCNGKRSTISTALIANHHARDLSGHTFQPKFFSVAISCFLAHILMTPLLVEVSRWREKSKNRPIQQAWSWFQNTRAMQQLFGAPYSLFIL